MLIATAGHIDHGKTSLIRALTGVETDRLPEERARGISIDLGFAYWRPDGDEIIGFVDVPGHERYIANMLAGVSGVDFALLVVAADDGVMPQTREHLAILDLLGITRGLVAITKCDRATPERRAQVHSDLAELLTHTTLAMAPIVPVSVATGAGVDDIATILCAARGTAGSRQDTDRQFRFAIDRRFTVTGAGTVVTGTVHAGRLSVGDGIVIAPTGLAARVRGLQSAEVKIDSIRAGERGAVNLAGIDLAQVRRGDWLVAPTMNAPSQRIAARVSVMAGRAAPLRHSSPLHLHHGTGGVAARLLTARQQPIAPGTAALAQLVLDEPICALTGDRFILRDPSGRELIGGGTVIDPWAPADRRGRADHGPVCVALANPGAAAALAALLALPNRELDTGWFERCFNLTAPAAQALYRNAGARLLGKPATIALPRARYDALGDEVVGLLGACHAAQPEIGGMSARDIRARLSSPISAQASSALLRALGEAARVDTSGPLLHLPGHSASFSPAETALWRAALDSIDERGPKPFPKPLDVVALARELHGNEAAVRAMLFRRRGTGDVWAITESKFMLRADVAALAASAAELADRNPEGFTAAEFRDATGIGRNFVIQLLEFFDRIGVTARRGAARIVHPDYATVTGCSAPYRPSRNPA